MSEVVHVTVLNQLQRVIVWRSVSKYTPAAKSNSQSLLKMFLIYLISRVIQLQQAFSLLVFSLTGGSEISYPPIPGG